VELALGDRAVVALELLLGLELLAEVGELAGAALAVLAGAFSWRRRSILCLARTRLVIGSVPSFAIHGISGFLLCGVTRRQMRLMWVHRESQSARGPEGPRDVRAVYRREGGRSRWVVYLPAPFRRDAH